MGFLEVRFVVGGLGGGGGSKLLPRLKLVRAILETWNLVHKYTHIFSFKNMPLSTKSPLILLISAFLQKKENFLSKIVYFTQIVWGCVRDFLVLLSVFVR